MRENAGKKVAQKGKGKPKKPPTMTKRIRDVKRLLSKVRAKL